MPRILIVDDEPPIRNLLSVAFQTAGYEVQTACNGVEALAMCRTATFDVVLSDVIMPQMDGHELARSIAVEQPSVQTVLMSGFDLICQNCPINRRCPMLSKPFRPAEAVSFVERLLAGPTN